MDKTESTWTLRPRRVTTTMAKQISSVGRDGRRSSVRTNEWCGFATSPQSGVDISVAILAQAICCSNVALIVTQRALLFGSLLPLVRRGAAQRLDSRTQWLGAVHPRSPTAFSPLANGAGQPSTACTRGPLVSETSSSGPGWTGCSSTTSSEVQTFGGSPRPRFHSRGSPHQS